MYKLPDRDLKNQEKLEYDLNKIKPCGMSISGLQAAGLPSCRQN
jgi:hypothetical protein